MTGSTNAVPTVTTVGATITVALVAGIPSTPVSATMFVVIVNTSVGLLPKVTATVSASRPALTRVGSASLVTPFVFLSPTTAMSLISPRVTVKVAEMTWKQLYLPPSVFVGEPTVGVPPHSSY